MTRAERRRAGRAKREGRARREALLVDELSSIHSVKHLQPDDRPHSPNMLRSRSWVTVTDIRASARRSEKPSGWMAVVCNFDPDTPKRQMVQSGTITTPDYKPSGARLSANRRPLPEDARRTI